MSRVFTNHHHATVPADDLALLADFFDAWFNFHFEPRT